MFDDDEPEEASPKVNIYRERVYRLARQIPEGRVMTYGQIAEILDDDGQKYTAQTVGWAMHALGDTDCWARVINAQGRCSTGKVMVPGNKQQFILEKEGVVFDATGQCSLEQFLWIPDQPTMDAARTWEQKGASHAGDRQRPNPIHLRDETELPLRSRGERQRLGRV